VDALSEAPAPVPVPLRVTVCGLPVALSATESVAVRAPLVVGVNVTVMEQVPPLAATFELVEQVLVEMAKSPLFVPVIEMLLNVSAPVPLLVSVELCPVLVVPTFWLV